MAAALRRNVERLREARGLTSAELSRRAGVSEAYLREALATEEGPNSALLRALAEQLLVPDFVLLAPRPLNISPALVDFRSAEPAPTGFSRTTLKAIELGRSIQREAARIGDFSTSNSLRAAIASPRNPHSAAKELRTVLGISISDQLAARNAREFYSFVRSRIESREVIVLQLSFEDGAGFCLASSDSYPIVVVNTLRQNYPRRLFSLAHEVYHCILVRSGLSDPEIESNRLEARCNRFAAEFLAPNELVQHVAADIFGGASDFEIDSLRRFASATKLSLHASVLSLIEAGIFRQSALGAWMEFVRTQGNPDFSTGQSGGRRAEEWKYKLAKYGFLLPRIFGRALEQKTIDEVGIFRSSGIKPKYQREYFENAFSASPEDAQDE